MDTSEGKEPASQQFPDFGEEIESDESKGMAAGGMLPKAIGAIPKRKPGVSEDVKGGSRALRGSVNIAARTRAASRREKLDPPEFAFPDRRDHEDATSVTSGQASRQWEDPELPVAPDARSPQRIERAAISSTRYQPSDPRSRIVPNDGDYQFSEDEIDPCRGRPLSAVALLNTMKRWDLSFSGRPGEDVEDFLTCMDEGRS